MKAIAISVVVLGALLFGAVIAYAGWGWNAKVDVNGTVVSTAWTVVGDEDGANNYRAKIKITVPEDADAEIVETAVGIEKVSLRSSKKLQCTEAGAESTVSYKVKHVGDGEPGDHVEVTVSQVSGGAVLASASGSLGETITVNALIPGVC
ncbi:MAG: hypothetical protein O3A93_09035 [Chloroflexi bacterium]|nr:hypothetical protein [Chloroflexota bacterium]MDA1271391.1 hypothetical protein [Chloroflexota bacterium]